MIKTTVKNGRTYAKLVDLKNWESNPRGIVAEDYADLIEELRPGLTDPERIWKPLVVNQDGVVMGGNMRLRAMQELGFKEAFVAVYKTKNEREMMEVALKDNGRWGYYEEDKLAEKALELKIDLTKFKVDVGQLTPLSVIVDKFREEVREDEPPALSPDPPHSVLGEIYQLGRHRLMCGDATKKEDAEKLMAGQKADMVFTDPPYGMDYSGRGKETSEKIIGDNQDPTEFYNLGSEISERYIWGRIENYKHLSTEPRDTIIWKKNNFGMGRGYRGQYECCFYYGDFSGSDSDVWELSKDINYEHPTQKPVTLCARAIRNSQPKVVIDYFLGSGSTLIACEQTDRICYGMEIDPRYVDVIRKRYWKFTHEDDEAGWEEGTPAIKKAKS